MFCPECGETLRAVEEADVVAEICPRCHGMWLRQEALRRLVEHEAGELALAFREADRDRERDDYFREIGGTPPAVSPHPSGFPGEPRPHAPPVSHGVLDALRRHTGVEGSKTSESV